MLHPQPANVETLQVQLQSPVQEDRQLLRLGLNHHIDVSIHAVEVEPPLLPNVILQTGVVNHIDCRVWVPCMHDALAQGAYSDGTHEWRYTS